MHSVPARHPSPSTHPAPLHPPPPHLLCLQVVQHVDLPVWSVYLVQSVSFGGGLLGITYGIVSASWDPRREGSLLGIDELRANLPILLDRFKRG